MKRWIKIAVFAVTVWVSSGIGVFCYEDGFVRRWNPMIGGYEYVRAEEFMNTIESGHAGAQLQKTKTMIESLIDENLVQSKKIKQLEDKLNLLLDPNYVPSQATSNENLLSKEFSSLTSQTVISRPNGFLPSFNLGFSMSGIFPIGFLAMGLQYHNFEGQVGYGLSEYFESVYLKAQLFSALLGGRFQLTESVHLLTGLSSMVQTSESRIGVGPATINTASWYGIYFGLQTILDHLKWSVYIQPIHINFAGENQLRYGTKTMISVGYMFF